MTKYVLESRLDTMYFTNAECLKSAIKAFDLQFFVIRHYNKYEVYGLGAIICKKNLFCNGVVYTDGVKCPKALRNLK